jgi:hypothetical protein
VFGRAQRPFLLIRRGDREICEVDFAVAEQRVPQCRIFLRRLQDVRRIDQGSGFQDADHARANGGEINARQRQRDGQRRKTRQRGDHAREPLSAAIGLR